MKIKTMVQDFIIIFISFVLADYINSIENDWLTAVIAFVFIVIINIIINLLKKQRSK